MGSISLQRYQKYALAQKFSFEFCDIFNKTADDGILHK